MIAPLRAPVAVLRIESTSTPVELARWARVADVEAELHARRETGWLRLAPGHELLRAASRGTAPARSGAMCDHPPALRAVMDAL